MHSKSLILCPVSLSMFTLKDVLLLLAGAIVGFGVDRIKALRDRRIARKQLRQELSLNLRMLPHFRRFAEDALAASQRHEAPNMRAIHFARVCYEANIPPCFPCSAKKSEVPYHIIYDHLAICNEISDEASRLLTATLSQEEFDRRLRVSAWMFDSLLAVATH